MRLLPRNRLLLGVACVLHAALVSGLWYEMIMLDRKLVTVRTWVAIAIGWLLWFLVLAFSGKRERIRWLGVLALCAFILSPTFSTLYTFAVWSIQGFAP